MKKTYIRLKDPIELTILALFWGYIAVYLWGSRTMIWSNGFLAMRICAVLAFLFTIPIVKHSFVRMTEEEYQQWQADRRGKKLSQKTLRIYILLVVLVVYIALLQPLGFFVDTVIFIFGIMLWLGVRSKPVLALVPLLTSGILFYVFKYVLYVRLPLGLLKYIL